MPAESKATPKRGRGRPVGHKLPARSIERIRASINAKLCVDTLHDVAQHGGKHDGSRVQAAAVLLKKVLPDLASVEHTGAGGGPVQFVFEKVDD